MTWPHVLIDETAGRPWHPSGDHYRHTFADVRAAAAATHPELVGFHDQDLRDTAVTWWARAGCTVPEITAITGHSEATCYTILKHYLGRHPELARNAMKKIAAWLDARGGQAKGA